MLHCRLEDSAAGLELGAGWLVYVKHALYPPGFAFPYHDQDFHEIAIVVDGIGWHDAAGGTVPLKVGDCLCVGPGQSHRLRAGGNNSLVFICIIVSSTAVSYHGEAGIWSVECPQRHHLNGDDRHNVLDHIQDLERRDGTHDRISAMAFLSDLAWRIDRTSRAVSADNRWLSALQAVLSQPGGVHLGAKDLAHEVGCTREHLGRIVSLHYGKTLTDLIRKRRLDQAAWMLSNCEDPIESVAQKCGYQSVSRFYDNFKRHFSVTPKVWRQQRRRSFI